MKTAEAIAAIIIVLGIVAFVIGGLVYATIKESISKRRRKHDHDAPWVLDEDQVGQAIQVQLVKPGEEPFLIGAPVSINLPHWDYQEEMESRRVEAEDKLATLNRPRLGR